MTVSEYVMKTIDSFPKYFNVALFWKDPFGVLNKRTGFFEEYMEAEGFSKYLNDRYSNTDMPYVIYINHKRMFANNVEDLLNAKVG